MEAAGGKNVYGSYAIGIPLYPATSTAANASINAEQPSAPPLTQPTTRQRHLSATAIAAYMLMFLASALCVASVVLLVLLFVFTQSPKFGLTSVSVSKFNISSGSEITAEWEVGFLVRNPNPVWRHWFDHPVVSVYYRDQLVSELESFPQVKIPRKTTQSYMGKTVALGKRIEDREVAEAMARDWSEKGVVAFTIRLLETNYDYTNMKVTCGDVEVGFSRSKPQEGTMLLQQSNDSEAFTRCSTYVLYQNSISLF
ncbi:hypothetical protein COLO4_29763 [Corchorus olitorius]|uniref:Late embryogenesis abundant protein, LEA-14 n=1 Tax=Corchorus olitorius TaxID=93759 RepID=A0A1R3HDC7_9ROSI|nr:hypothetical protein COLO4_29763 [Corchorus olitorius]